LVDKWIKTFDKRLNLIKTKVFWNYKQGYAIMTKWRSRETGENAMTPRLENDI